MPSASTYNIQVTKAGYEFLPKVVTTGTSTDRSITTGNLWGINFAAKTKTLPGILQLLLQ